MIKKLDEFKKNFIFALGLDNEVPKHLAREIFGEDIVGYLKAKNKSVENELESLTLKIADTVWNKIGSKDVRDMLQVGKLSKTVGDVEFMAQTLHKYMRNRQ